MGTPLHIALRYLFARKRHNVINIISIISAAGIAIGSMALVLIVSVYNGFDNSIKNIYESYKADFVITPTIGKTFEVNPQTLSELEKIPHILQASTILQENAYVRYDNREAIVQIKGVNPQYLNHSHILENVVEGEPRFFHGENRYAVVGQPLAYHLSLKSRFITPLEIYFPQKTGTISVVNPLEGLNTITVRPSATIKTENQNQDNILYLDSQSAHALTGTPENHFSNIEIYLAPDSMPSLTPRKLKEIAKSLEKIFPGCSVKDKQQQNSTLYKVIKAEKFAVYLILFFVIIIISINIFSCLSMLVTEKREDIETYLSIGATKELVGKIFHLHGFLISLAGCSIGTIVGITLALIQQKFGIITISGSYIIDAYPIDVRILDILIIFAGVTGIGFIISYLPMKNFFKN